MIEKGYQEQVDIVLRRIKEERLKANLSQIELSFAAGLSNCFTICLNWVHLVTSIAFTPGIALYPFSKAQSKGFGNSLVHHVVLPTLFFP